MYKIAISMRQSKNEAYYELRDCLSSEWPYFINKVFGEAAVIPISNNLECARMTVTALQPDGIILSNGNSLGTCHARDEVERYLWNWTKEYNKPLFGICRGLQAINLFEGGTISEMKGTDKGSHVNTEHKVKLIDNPYIPCEQLEIEVNSFHNQCVTLNNLSKMLRPIAIADGNIVEALYHKESPIVAVQWHPERLEEPTEFDMKLFRSVFKLNEKQGSL